MPSTAVLVALLSTITLACIPMIPPDFEPPTTTVAPTTVQPTTTTMADPCAPCVAPTIMPLTECPANTPNPGAPTTMPNKFVGADGQCKFGVNCANADVQFEDGTCDRPTFTMAFVCMNGKFYSEQFPNKAITMIRCRAI